MGDVQPLWVDTEASARLVLSVRRYSSCEALAVAESSCEALVAADAVNAVMESTHSAIQESRHHTATFPSVADEHRNAEDLAGPAPSSELLQVT